MGLSAYLGEGVDARSRSKAASDLVSGPSADTPVRTRSSPFDAVLQRSKSQYPQGVGELRLNEAPVSPIPSPPAINRQPKVQPMTQQAIAPIGSAPHPALGKAELLARELNEGLFIAEEIRIRRLLQELLPIRVSSIEGFGERVLSTGRALTSRVTQLSVELAQLNATEMLNLAVAQTSPTTGFLSRFKAKVMAPPVTGPQIDALKGELVKIQTTVREIVPDCKAAELRVSLHFLALSAISSMLGRGEAAELVDTMNRRKMLLMTAHGQSQLTAGQLNVLEQTVASLRGQCEQIASVLLTTHKLIDVMR